MWEDQLAGNCPEHYQCGKTSLLGIALSIEGIVQLAAHCPDTYSTNVTITRPWIPFTSTHCPENPFHTVYAIQPYTFLLPMTSLPLHIPFFTGPCGTPQAPHGHTCSK